jgi:hypothetical protein
MRENDTSQDLRTARDRAAHASQFVFPLYRVVGTKQVVQDVIKVTAMGHLPDGRWMAEHGPFYCMADAPDEWVGFAPDPNPLNRLSTDAEERLHQWKAFLKEATFTSLEKTINAAVAEQRRTQEQLDALARKEGAGS